MSCDYGLKCLDCDESIVPDNYAHYGAFMAKDRIFQLAQLHEIAQEIQVEISAHWLPDSVTDFLHFCYKHRRHNLVVVDEYDHEHHEKF